MASEANEPGSESGKRSDDRRGVPEGTPQEGGASTPLAAPGSFAAAAMITGTASWARVAGRGPPSPATGRGRGGLPRGGGRAGGGTGDARAPGAARPP